MNEEMLIKLSLLEQQARQLEQQIEQVDSQIQEFETLILSLSKLKDNKSKEILTPIGRGIFSKAELKEDKFFVNIGSGIFVKKDSGESIEVINKQISQLKEIRIELIKAISKINEELDVIVNEAEIKK